MGKTPALDWHFTEYSTGIILFVVITVILFRLYFFHIHISCTKNKQIYICHCMYIAALPRKKLPYLPFIHGFNVVIFQFFFFRSRNVEFLRFWCDTLNWFFHFYMTNLDNGNKNIRSSMHCGKIYRLSVRLSHGRYWAYQFSHTLCTRSQT